MIPPGVAADGAAAALRPAAPRPLRRTRPGFLALLVLLAAAACARPSDLAVEEADGRWSSWSWPERTPGGAPLAQRIRWQAEASGVASGRLAVAKGGIDLAVDLIVIRIAPDSVRFALAWDRDPDSGAPAWDLERTPPGAVVSLNAGMFLGTAPWGWVVVDGAERLVPGPGPLSSALAVDRAGRLHWNDGDDLTSLRGRPDLELAFQSYPTLLTAGGVLPPELLGGSAIDRRHRDIRLALGLDAEGRLLVVLTRCRLPLPGAERLPLGLTIPEMARVMGALGARRAVSLDGGLSAQLLLRDGAGRTHRWSGLRKVPLALIVYPRPDPGTGDEG